MLKKKSKKEQRPLQLCSVAFLLTLVDYLAKRKRWMEGEQEAGLLQVERLRRHDQVKEFSVQRDMTDPEADHMLDWLNLETISLDPKINELQVKIREWETDLKHRLHMGFSMARLLAEAKVLLDIR